jgi:hypothetical protein
MDFTLDEVEYLITHLVFPPHLPHENDRSEGGFNSELQLLQYAWAHFWAHFRSLNANTRVATKIHQAIQKYVSIMASGLINEETLLKELKILASDGELSSQERF